MGSISGQSIEMVRSKMRNCVRVLEDQLLSTYKLVHDANYIGAANYDPINSKHLLASLWVAHSASGFSVYYLDLDRPKIVKVVDLDRWDQSEDIQSIKVAHAALYGGLVEGSYVLIDNDGDWCILYDALEDIALIYSSVSVIKAEIGDFLLNEL